MNQRSYFFIVFITALMTSILTFFLFREYRLLQKQFQILNQLQQDYRDCVNVLKKKEYEDEKCDVVCPVENGTQDDGAQDNLSFIQINRNLEYLKKSMTEYMKERCTEGLLSQIDDNYFIGYTDQLLASFHTSAQQQKIKKRKLQKRLNGSITDKARGPKVGRYTKVVPLHLCWPIDKGLFWISSFFGPRKKPNGVCGYHHGIDMAALRGTPVKAAADGLVSEARYSKGYGKTIVILHANNYKTRYAHLNDILVHIGDRVVRGQKIGKVGATGQVRKRGNDASHLHAEVYYFGKRVDPLYYFSE